MRSRRAHFTPVVAVLVKAMAGAGLQLGRGGHGKYPWRQPGRLHADRRGDEQVSDPLVRGLRCNRDNGGELTRQAVRCPGRGGDAYRAYADRNICWRSRGGKATL